MPFMSVAALSVRVIVAIVVTSLPTTNVVNGSCYPCPGLLPTGFPRPGIIADAFILAGIVSAPFCLAGIIVCVCGLRRLNPWLRKGRAFGAVLGFEFCCVAVVWFGDAC